jgi:pimeloyl-ACP methyl ester carboxylesterase
MFIKKHTRRLLALAAAFLAFMPFWGSAAVAQTNVPIIFIHGAAGSGAQYQSQAMRFTSNGFPANYIRVFEYDSQQSASSQITPLDNFINSVRSELGVSKVNIVAHSLGTFITASYLDSRLRAAKVAKYVGIDGATGWFCPGSVPCMGVWGQGSSLRRLGSNNVRLSTQSHVQVCTSAESFAAQYNFLMGRTPPQGSTIATQSSFQISGRAVNFPANTGANGATLRIYAVNATNGARTASIPIGTFSIGSTGAWGPITVSSQQHYEFEVVRSGLPTVHSYSQPFLRASNLVRLNLSPAGSGTLTNTNVSDFHSAMVITRYKEWWTSQSSATNDRITITTVSGNLGTFGPHDLLSRLTSNGAIGIHVHDDTATPRSTSLNTLSYFSSLPFQTGVDVYMPAFIPNPNGYIEVANTPRGNTARIQRISVPNWASSGHRISVEFNDYVQ